MKFLAVAALVFIALPVFAPHPPLLAQQLQPQVSGDFTRTAAVSFAQGKSGPLLSDLYLPKGQGLFPAVVFIHGGGWTSGNRTQMTKVIEFLFPHG